MTEKPPTIASKEQKHQYEFFKTKTSRENLFKASKGISEYILEKKIPNIFILDRSSRPVYLGIKKYFEHEHPKEKVPNIYFINPKGTKAIENMGEDEITETIIHSKNQNGPDETVFDIRKTEEISKDFQETYKELIKQKDQPILVFDTCAHTGGSLKHVENTLKNEDFQEIKFLTFNPPDKNSVIQSDSIEKEEHGCNVFSEDKMVEKTFKSVLSTKNSNKEKIDQSIRLRKEIIEIMEDFLSNQETLPSTEEKEQEILEIRIKNDTTIKELMKQKIKLFEEQEKYLSQPARLNEINSMLDRVNKEIQNRIKELKN